jgi:hypothetical protein
MTKAEYAAQAAAQDDWAPGWLAIDAAFESVYPGVTPRHLGSSIPARAIFGGEEYLDGISLFPSSNGYQHLLTYGMSKLYADEEAYGDFSEELDDYPDQYQVWPSQGPGTGRCARSLARVRSLAGSV